MSYQQNMQDDRPADMLRKVCDWKELFSPEILEEAAEDPDLKQIRSSGSWYGQRFEFTRLWPRTVTTIEGEPRFYTESWRDIRMRCSCGQSRCVHLAASFLFWEKKHGPWVVWESEYEYKTRKEREAVDLLLEERRKQAARIGTQPIPALDAFKARKDTPGPVIFDMEKALSDYVTTPYAICRMKEVLRQDPLYGDEILIEEARDGKKTILFRQQFEDIAEAELVWGKLSESYLQICYSWQKRDSRYNTSFFNAPNERAEGEPLDEYALAAIARVWKKVDEEGRSSVTDSKAQRFFQRIQKMREESSRKEIRTLETEPAKLPVVELLPRIVIEEGNPVLSFKIGVTGSRKYVVKDCYKLIAAVQKESVHTLGKSAKIHFGKQSIVPEDLRLFEFIQRHRAQSVGGAYQTMLEGSRLDNFYDMYEGGECELVDKTNHVKDKLIKVGHMDIHFVLTADRLTDARGSFMGIAVSGFVPVLISGNSHKYVLNTTGLSRITKEEKKVLDPFLEAADASGYFRFQVGTENFQEFYYRIIPGLLENPFVEFVDNCSEEAAPYLPPEPVFRFYADLEENELTLKCLVRYEEREEIVAPSGLEPPSDEYRDTEQEQRVLHAIGEWFPDYDRQQHAFVKMVDDDSLYDFLTAGLGSLEYYGSVNGSAAFRAQRILPEPKMQIGISVDSGNLLNISVTSKDLDPKEFLAVYRSYKKKKRYYRLKSGDYVDLTRENQFQDLELFMGQLDIRSPEILQKQMKLPMYRALYLNKMLEEHENLVISRDRTYRALIRNFKTVQEADYEVPEAMEETLRPYQVYGYKWLRTLQAAGFGGILSDEMGLGKTLQMIAVFENDRLTRAAQAADDTVPAAGTAQAQPSLVICPASLVYNWQEEIARFAPDLRCIVIAGTAGARKKILAKPEAADVFVTSYDLARRDVTLYKDLGFCNLVLDEAQYIKNAAAGISKSVKLIHAEHRFALTGTPIENRLSELWSIFDFLMPGFLYGHRDFENRFERPIAKAHDESATAKLKSMTSPFILRRKKADVLKDLPDKLEEVRYARVSGEQQKLYDAQVMRMKGMLGSGVMQGEEKIRMFAELTRIRQICCDPSLLFEGYRGGSAKREACLDLVRSAIEGGHRMLIFSQFVSMLELLEDDLRAEKIEYCKIVGATPKEKRIALVRDFNEGDVPVFLISLKAGGTGLNLTGADVVIHYDPWWNLAVQNQATDRAHRIGQTRQVTVYKLILKDTIEERILQLQDAKKDLAEAILEGSSQSILSLSAEELMALLG